MCFLIAFSLAGSALPQADSSENAKRDKALQGVEACLRRNWVPSRECKNLKRDIETLIGVYQQGDKSVLSTLLKFTYLTEFYGDAITSDPDGFLTAVSRLPEAEQRAVAAGIAGPNFGLPRARFDAVRATLMKVPDSSSNYELARTLLRAVEAENASFLVNYFPPKTFTGRAADFQVHWFSKEFYSLENEPMWPPAAGGGGTYRVTVLPAFVAPESVTMTVMSDGTGQIQFRTLDLRGHRLNVGGVHAVSQQQAADFAAILNRVQFWQLPPELPPDLRHVVMDGTRWILEGMQNGSYHIIVRECPGKTSFAEAAGKLFNLSGQKSKGGC